MSTDVAPAAVPSVIPDDVTSVPLIPAQVAQIERILTESGEVPRAVALLRAARRPDLPTDDPDAAEVRALRPPADRNLAAALLRIARAVDSETTALYERKDNGETAVLGVLRNLGFRLLELGFTVAEEGGVDCRDVEAAIACAYGVPDQGQRIAEGSSAPSRP